MRESYDAQHSPYEKFNISFEERRGLWCSIIDSSHLAPDTKEKFKEIVSERPPLGEKGRGLGGQDYNLDDWVYDTVGALYDEAGRLKNTGENPEELDEVFETLKSDMWDFWKECKG